MLSYAVPKLPTLADACNPELPGCNYHYYDTNNSGPLIAGLLLGALALVLIAVGVVLLIVFLVRRKGQAGQAANPAADSAPRAGYGPPPGAPGGGAPFGGAPAGGAPVPSAGPAGIPAPPNAQPSGPAPGWFPDPSARFRWRWWDGVRWSDDVTNGGPMTKDPLG